MATIETGAGVHTLVTTVDLAAVDAPQVLATLTAATRERAPRAAGLVSSTWLSRRPGDDGAARLVHYGQWRSGEHADGGAEPLLGLEEVGHLLLGSTVRGHDVHAVVCASGGARLLLAPGAGTTTYLIAVDAKAGEHEFLVRFNTTDTRRLFAPRPGFVASAILRSHDGRGLLEVVQWAGPGDFEAAAAHPDFAEHLATIDARAHSSDVGVFDVVTTL